jgi:hypothetical protein
MIIIVAGHWIVPTNAVEGFPAVVKAVRAVPSDDDFGEESQGERSHGDFHDGWMREMFGERYARSK